MATTPSSEKKKKNQNLGVARKIRGSGYPTDEQLSRYRRRIRVELVKDRQDAFGRNFWGKMDETKRIFCVSGNHNLHIRAYVRVRPLLVEETEEEGGDGPIPHFYEDGLKVYYPNISSSAEGKYKEFKAFSVFGDFVDQETLFDNVMPPSLRYFLSGGNAAFISYGSANSGKKFTLFGTDFWDYLETIYVPPGSKNNSKLLSSFKAENEDIDDDIEFSMFNLDTLLENSGMKEKKRHSRPQSRGNNSTRPRSRDDKSTRPQSRASNISNVPSSIFTTYPGDKRAVQDAKLKVEIPDCSEVDGIFPRAISYVFKEISHRQLYEQTNITIALSIIVVSDESKGSNEAFDMLSLNPSDSRSLQWNPNEEAFWPDDLVATTVASYKALLNELYRGYLARESLEMNGITTIYLLQCKINGISDRWDARGDRLSEGLEKTGKYFFVECSPRNNPNSNRSFNPDLNMTTLIKCLSKARFNSYPTGKEKKSLPLRESPLTQVLSSVLKPGQMLTFIGNISKAQRHYNESYTTCSDVNTVHVADDNLFFAERKSAVASTTNKSNTRTSKKKMQKKVKKPKPKKKVQKRDSIAEESLVNAKGIVTPIKNDKEGTNHKQNRRRNTENSNHELMVPIIARPSRLSEMLASSTLGSKSSTLATRKKQEKLCTSPQTSMMFIASNATNCNRIVYPENWKDES